MNFTKILRIAQREYRETIKTRTFLFSLILTPLLIVGLGFLNNRMIESSQRGPQPTRRIAVVDRSGEMATAVAQAIERYRQANPQRPLELIDAASIEPADQRIARYQADIRAGRLNGCLVIAPGAAGSNGAEPSVYYSRTGSVNDMEFFSTIYSVLNDAATTIRCARNNVSTELLAKIRQPVSIRQVELSKKTEGKPTAAVTKIMIPFFFMFLMFIGIMSTSQGLMLSVIEEKGSRVVEVLLAAVSPLELMAGKIAGLATVGLTLIGVWAVTALTVAKYFGAEIPLSATDVIYFTVYYCLGYLIIASIYAAVGSACNTIKEAQNMMWPITMIFVLPMMFWMPISQNPSGTLATALAFFPPTTPMIMILRMNTSAGVPALQIVASIVLLVVSAAAAVWVAARIFRVGILMTGKPPTPREMLRWLRYR